jgi:hypothetical protein
MVSSVQRQAATAGPIAPTRATAAAPIAVAPTPVQRQAITSPVPPTVSSPVTPTVADVAVANGLGQMTSDGAVVFAPPPQNVEPAPSVQRQADGSDGVAAAPATPPPAVVEPSVPAVQLAPSAPSAPDGTATGTTSREDLDELASRLYPRIRVQLRRELLRDRERSGTLIEVS